MRDFLYRIARRIYAGLDSYPDAERATAAGYVIRILVFMPLALIGLGWLAFRTDVDVLRENAPFLVALLVAMIALSQLYLQTYYVTETGSYRSERRSFWGEALWSGVLVLGPSVGWLGIMVPWIVFLIQAWRSTRLQRLRILSTSVFRMSIPLLTLIEAAIYEALGGTYPLPGLAAPDVLPAVWATLIGFSLGSLIMGGATGLIRMMSPPSPASRRSSLLSPSPRFAVLVALLGPFGGLVAIFPAGLYNMAGVWAYFAFIGLLLGGTIITDRLSASIESARRRTRELEHLEHLGRGIIQSPPDRLDLGALMAEHVPPMFPACRIAIRVGADQPLLTYPPDWLGPDPVLWHWQTSAITPHAFHPGEARPWHDDGARHGGTVIVPILAARSAPKGSAGIGAQHRHPELRQPVIGRIYLYTHELPHSVKRLIPAAQSLAGQIASALFSADSYRQSVSERAARQQADRELALGARIQTSFLPPEVPRLEGWEIAATLEPARETSGDFYDFIPLRGGRLGIVVADVADKGLGAAFYMALTCTLLRTYAVDSSLRYGKSYLYRLGEVIEQVNARLMHDTSGDTFVTLFYGILDPRTSTLCYINAGHNPPLLFHRDRRRRLRALRGTGPAIGMFDQFSWKRRSVKIEEGDVLLLYTDGLTEAEDGNRDQFGERRVEQVMRDNLHQPVGHLCDAILASVYDFAAGAPRSDDITMLLLRRKPGDGKTQP